MNAKSIITAAIVAASTAAEKFDVSRSLVRAIWRGEYWSHV